VVNSINTGEIAISHLDHLFLKGYEDDEERESEEATLVRPHNVWKLDVIPGQFGVFGGLGTLRVPVRIGQATV
jgi:hypothetical protein